LPHLLQLDRRSVLKGLLCLTSAALAGGVSYRALAENAPGTQLASRREGEMDIHHIDTGRGNCTLIVAPDGTTIMIDAGASNAPIETSSEARPNGSMRPGQWQARYASRCTDRTALDYMVVTHLHPDHLGDVSEQNPLSKDQAFRLTGVSDVDMLMPITTLIDRSFPDYGAAHPPTAAFSENYLGYLKSRVNAGRIVQRANVGSDRQIQLRNPERYPTFGSRILAANGTVWSGRSKTVQQLIPSKLPGGMQPNENIDSIALRLSYGHFSYYTGGDLTSDTYDGRYPWMDVETPTVQTAGRTEVATADHHGYFDACGPAFVRNLDAQVYIVQAWDIGHPGSTQMQRLLGAWPDKVTHDVFATSLTPANQLMNRRFAPQLKSLRGNIVVRVAQSGDSYHVFVTDSSDEHGIITGAFGPYYCRT
jgi:beta-lactamase superfamily II metal-dependent hydrolase